MGSTINIEKNSIYALMLPSNLDSINSILTKTVSSSALKAELANILELHERGLGLTRIAKRLYGNDSKRYRVWRLLKKVERGELPVSRAYGDYVAGGDGGHVAGSYSLQHEPEDSGQNPKTEPLLPVGLEGCARLGRTQRLVLDALATLLPPVHPSVIVAYIKEEFGFKLSRNAVWQALKRLEARGIVEKSPKGLYKLMRTHRSGIYVENFRVNGKQIWSTKEMGWPSSLEDALLVASLRNRTQPVEQVELFYKVGSPLGKLAEKLREMGWRQTKVYFNKSQGLKIEHQLWNSPLQARPGDIEPWRDLFRMSTLLTLYTAAEALGQHVEA